MTPPFPTSGVPRPCLLSLLNVRLYRVMFLSLQPRHVSIKVLVKQDIFVYVDFCAYAFLFRSCKTHFHLLLAGYLMRRRTKFHIKLVLCL